MVRKRGKESIVLGRMVLGNLGGSASVGRFLACYRTLHPSFHYFPYISVLFLPTDYEEAALQEDYTETMNINSIVNI